MGDKKSEVGFFKAVVFFDGSCGLCNRFVRVLIRIDGRGHLRFAPLQSEVWRSLAAEKGIAPRDTPDSVAFLYMGRVFFKMAALYEISKVVGGVWRLVSPLLFLLRNPVGDAFYDFVARHRYKIFGRRELCDVPTDKNSTRFIQS